MGDRPRKPDYREDIRWKLHYRMGGGELVPTWSCDISLHGLSFACDRTVPEGTAVDIYAYLIVNDQFKVMHFSGPVSYSNYSGDIQAFRIGIRFNKLSSQDRKDLENFLHHIDNQRGH